MFFFFHVVLHLFAKPFLLWIITIYQQGVLSDAEDDSIFNICGCCASGDGDVTEKFFAIFEVSFFGFFLAPSSYRRLTNDQ